MHTRWRNGSAARLLALATLFLSFLLGSSPVVGQTSGGFSLHLPFVSNIDGIGWIAWVSVSNRDGPTNIWTMRGDGSNQVELAIEGDEHSPSWAPDGKRIVFASNKDNANENDNLYWVHIDNTATVTRLTTYEGRDGDPAWSPDGAQIAFSRRISGTSTIWLMDADGSNLHQLTYGSDSQPSWSPDGSKIVFTRSTASTGSMDIYQVDRAGGEATQLVNTDVHESHPAYAPDGSTLAYLSNAPDGINHIWLRNADGVTSRLTTNTAPIESLAWSPGSEYIVYSMETSLGSTYFNLYKVNVRTGSVTQLISGTYQDWEPDWYP